MRVFAAAATLLLCGAVAVRAATASSDPDFALGGRFAFDQSEVVCEGETHEAKVRQEFWEDFDWGKVKEYRGKLTEYCAHPAGGSNTQDASSMVCADGGSRLEVCHGRRLRVSLGRAEKPFPGVYAQGSCTVKKTWPRAQVYGGKFNLRDWVNELHNFNLDFKQRRKRKDPSAAAKAKAPACSVEMPLKTLVIKNDAHNNIYHGICDHVNLFLTQHIVGWGDVPPSELQVMYWDDGTPINSRGNNRRRMLGTNLLPLYRAITSHPLRHFGEAELKGQQVCFDDVVFSVNPRTWFTFYYGMKVNTDCRAGPTSLQRTFARTLRDRLLMPRPPPTVPAAAATRKVRVLLLSRSTGRGKTSGTRHVTNEEQLVARMRGDDDLASRVELSVRTFDRSERVGIAQQIADMASADILVSMHSAGLVHMLWLPSWGGVFEIYACEDRCYADLAKVQGLLYYTLSADDVEKRAPTAVAVTARNKKNPKFWDYHVDPEPFLGYLQMAVAEVEENPRYVKAVAGGGDGGGGAPGGAPGFLPRPEEEGEGARGGGRSEL